MQTIRARKQRTGRRHWHPLIDAVIRAGGIKPESDCSTGRLADEYQWLRAAPGLLNKKGLALDEFARLVPEDYPDLLEWIPGDPFGGGLYAEDLRGALEDALQTSREKFEGKYAEDPPEYAEPDPEPVKGKENSFDPFSGVDLLAEIVAAVEVMAAD